MHSTFALEVGPFWEEVPQLKGVENIKLCVCNVRAVASFPAQPCLEVKDRAKIPIEGD